MSTHKVTSIKKKLEDIVQNEPHTIRASVAVEALSYGFGDILPFFYDLLTHGCSAGMVKSLISYYDTATFFDTHYNEIENLRMEYEESTGEPFRIESDLKNTLAWFGFEETARKMADEFEIEI